MMDLDSLRLGFAFSAGAATFFAPCSFPLLPGYVAYYLGAEEESRSPGGLARRAAIVGVAASLGFFLVYAILTGFVVAVGAETLANISILELVVGGVLIVLGTAMAVGGVDAGLPGVALPRRRRSLFGFFLFGVGYAAAAAGCTAPIFVAIATLGLSAGPVGGLLTMGAYAGGMSVLMIAITGLSAAGRGTLLRVRTDLVEPLYRVAGVLLVLAGIAQVYLFLFEFGGLELLGLA